MTNARSIFYIFVKKIISKLYGSNKNGVVATLSAFHLKPYLRDLKYRICRKRKPNIYLGARLILTSTQNPLTIHNVIMSNTICKFTLRQKLAKICVYIMNEYVFSFCQSVNYKSQLYNIVVTILYLINTENRCQSTVK